MKYKKESILSVIVLALVALAWGTSYAIIKDALNEIKPFTLMTLRFGISTIILSIIFIRRLTKVKKKDIYQGSIIGLFMFIAFFTLVTGISYTTASKQSFIIGAYVLIVPFLGWITNKKRPDSYSIIGAALATVGIGLLTVNNSFIINKGDLIALLCSISFACHMISIEKFSMQIDPIISTIIQFAVTALLFTILTGVFESFNFILSPKAAKSVIYLVIVSTIIAFLVQNIAQRYISSTSTALVLTLESAFGGIFAVLFLNEIMTTQMVIGCIVVFVGIFIGENKLKFFKIKAMDLDNQI